VSRIPAHIWQFCTKEIKLYRLRKNELEDAKQRAAAIYEEGGFRGWNQTMTQTGYTTSPVITKIERIDQIMNAPEVLLNMKRCRYMDEVIEVLSEEEKEVLETCFWVGKNTNEAAVKLHMSPRKVQYLKRGIVEKLAVRWGML